MGEGKFSSCDGCKLIPILQVEIDWDQIGAKIEDEFQKEREAGKRS